MDTVKNILSSHFTQALERAYPAAIVSCPMLQLSRKPQFGDYQANFAMEIAKRIKQPPREVAKQVVERLEASTLWEKIDIAGPGFINISLSNTFLQSRLQYLLSDERLGVVSGSPQVIVVDYSGTNVAKEMHVGHLRSTIIGDTIARVFEFQGHRVIRQNHVGDWGTQFGMLIEYMLETEQVEVEDRQIAELNELYKKAKQKFDSDQEFARRARERVVALQSHDGPTVAIWRNLVAVSNDHFNEVFSRLGVGLNRDHTRGESFYNDRLDDLVHELQMRSLARIDQGAVVVELEGFVDRDDNPLPLLIRKSDGGYLYSTSDLAAARYRVDELSAERVIYVTDARQSQHFAMVFAALCKAGWVSEQVSLEHVPFGAMLGEDRKPFKTRSGEMISLISLLDEASERAFQALREKNPEVDFDELELLATDIGIASLKYADLKTERIKDYIFSWDRMISFDGNTALYLLNAYVRIHSMFRKAGLQIDEITGNGGQTVITDHRERALAIQLFEFPDVVNVLGQDLLPHRLCNYLYDLASSYHRFYEACPVLTAETNQYHSRLALSALTARTMKQGLRLLGIKTVNRM